MSRLDQHRIGRRTAVTLSAGVALLAIAAITPVSANAAVCTDTVRGPHSGVLNVAANKKLCLVGAVQDGAVNVSPKGGLSVINSTITGAVTLKDNYSEFRFCGSKTIRGAISATGGQTAVFIGGGLDCAANTVDGAVTLTANKAGVTLANNPTIAGAVSATANLGGTTISNNRIKGALGCTDNAPPPTNAGVANAVTGARSGQCALL
jgi:hypothetical protein